MIAYTSGTTGRPKGAVHVHGGFLVKMASETAYQTDLHPDETLYWVTDMGWIMGPWEMVGAGCIGATRGHVRGRARLARARPRVGVGRAPPRERARRLADADPGAQDRRRRAPGEARPLEPARVRLDRRAVEPRALPVAVRGGRRRARCRSSTSRAAPRSARASSRPIRSRRSRSARSAARRTAWTSTCSTDGQPGARRGRGAGLQAAVAGDDARHLGRPRALHRDLLVDVPGRLAPRRLGADRRRRRLVPARPLRRHDQRGGQAARPGRGRVGAGLASGGGRVRGRGRARRDQGRGDLVLLRRRRTGRARRPPRSCASWSRSELGRPFKPSRVVFVDALPKTRSAKILRRAVRAVAVGEDPGDMSSAENPQALDEIRAALG